jgi:hypothetical protein
MVKENAERGRGEDGDNMYKKKVMKWEEKSNKVKNKGKKMRRKNVYE